MINFFVENLDFILGSFGTLIYLIMGLGVARMDRDIRKVKDTNTIIWLFWPMQLLAVGCMFDD